MKTTINFMYFAYTHTTEHSDFLFDHLETGHKEDYEKQQKKAKGNRALGFLNYFMALSLPLKFKIISLIDEYFFCYSKEEAMKEDKSSETILFGLFLAMEEEDCKRPFATTLNFFH